MQQGYFPLIGYWSIASVVVRSYDLLRPVTATTPRTPREGGNCCRAFPWFVSRGRQRLIDKAGNLRRSLMMLCSRHPAQVARRRAIDHAGPATVRDNSRCHAGPLVLC